MNIVITTIKSWNISKANALKEEMQGKHTITVISSKEEFTLDKLDKIQPDMILLPHWSYIIPDAIFEKYPCVVFHMTDLPYGRGGSPLQNLIVRGHKETKLSAIKVTKTLDEGPVYMKLPLSLEGSATEIFERCSKLIFEEMIPVFLEDTPEPVPQVGEPTIFKRRKPEDGEIKEDFSLEKIYDYVRMLDAEGYPKAFIDFGPYRMEFDSADFSKDSLEAHVKITRRDTE